MARPSKPLTLAFALAFTSIVHADALPKPVAVSVDEAAGPRFSWSPVEGAAVYRVAVFDAPDVEGKRPLLAAVWVATPAWAYAKDAVIAKAGKLGSTKPLPLPAGHKLRVMVAAAREAGADKSDWTGTDFSLKAAAPPTPLPVPSATATPTPAPAGKPGADAELELEGGEEFKSSPEPAVIDLNEDGAGAVGGVHAKAATGKQAQTLSSTALAGPSGAGSSALSRTAVSAASATAGSTASSASPSAATASDGSMGTADAEPSLDAARALVKAGKADDAEAMFKALTVSDPKSSDAWEGLGDAYAARQMKAEAVEAYEQALKYNKAKVHLQEWIDKNVRR